MANKNKLTQSLESNAPFLSGLATQSKAKFDNDIEESKRRKQAEVMPFKKPNSDYYSLDLVVRETRLNPKTNHNVMTEEIKTDYREYLNRVRGSQSITKYIHGLIDADMKRKNK